MTTFREWGPGWELVPGRLPHVTREPSPETEGRGWDGLGVPIQNGGDPRKVTSRTEMVSTGTGLVSRPLRTGLTGEGL